MELTSRVFASPGTPIKSACPWESMHINIFSIASSCPIMILPISFLIAANECCNSSKAFTSVSSKPVVLFFVMLVLKAYIVQLIYNTLGPKLFKNIGNDIRDFKPLTYSEAILLVILFRFFTPLRAKSYVLPVPRPFFSPVEWFFTDWTDFKR